ncbi:BET1-like protein isoform X1 [Erinaceus europaeus]|uniref:BET1-like protein isoform X1 n=1 Tax=Erinaceus europaeus TaxID=9365 RepID=A0ABM3W5G5_ERIEU|nr:BET1-like protein isoform X1 [Erinaceus europaeus]
MADWTRAQSPDAVEGLLDRENKRMADSLATKVTRLKSLALDIDRDAEDHNRYLDGMVRDRGLRFRQCDRPLNWECEALLYNGTVWERQPEASVWRGYGPGCGLLHSVLLTVQSKDVSPWEPPGAGFWGCWGRLCIPCLVPWL